MKNLFSIEGKVAVVTGGSTGIGAMIARGFVENGVKTYITARNLEQLETSALQLSEYGECIAIQSDLSSMEGVLGFAAAIAEREPKLDILVNNAGAAWGDERRIGCCRARMTLQFRRWRTADPGRSGLSDRSWRSGSASVWS